MRAIENRGYERRTEKHSKKINPLDYVKDAGMVYGDYLGGLVGVDMFGDHRYANEGFAKAGNVGTQVGKVAGQVAATVAGGPVAGTALTAVQGAAGSIQDSARKDYEHSEFDLAARSIGDIGSMLAGQISGGMGQSGQTPNIKISAMGGKRKRRFQDGGNRGNLVNTKKDFKGQILKNVTTVEGPPHSRGGVTTKDTLASGGFREEMEGGEVIKRLESGKEKYGEEYVLSKELIDSKTGLSFADLAKKEVKKIPSFRRKDKLSVAMANDVIDNKIIPEQEAMREELGLTEESNQMAAYGGKRKYTRGGERGENNSSPIDFRLFQMGQMGASNMNIGPNAFQQPLPPLPKFEETPLIKDIQAFNAPTLSRRAGAINMMQSDAYNQKFEMSPESNIADRKAGQGYISKPPRFNFPFNPDFIPNQDLNLNTSTDYSNGIVPNTSVFNKGQFGENSVGLREKGQASTPETMQDTQNLFKRDFTPAALGYAAQAFATSRAANQLKPNLMQAPGVNAAQIDLTEQRRQALRESRTQMALSRRGASGADSAGMAMNFLAGAGSDIYGRAGEAIGASFMNEANTNAQLRMDAGKFNAGARLETDARNMAELGRVQEGRADATMRQGDIAATAGRDFLNTQEQDAMMNILMASNPDYTFEVGPDGKLKRVKRIRDGETTSAAYGGKRFKSNRRKR